MRVGLVDSSRFGQESLAKAFAGLNPRVAIHAFAVAEDCLAMANANQDVLIYHSHATDAWDARAQQDVATLQKAFGAVPLVVMSDIADGHQAATLRSALKGGARAFIPTRSTGISMTLAIIQFVIAGGTFAPIDLLLGDSAEPGRATQEAPKARFTSRQAEVLSLLGRGMANKAIAHELGMSESTVKVHVRNIMRVTGATNRTQAAYNVQAWSTGDMPV